jgi:hypothetical protein
MYMMGFSQGGSHMGGVMVSMLVSSVVDHGFKSQSGQTKDFLICISCFSDKLSLLRRKNKDWLARNRDKASKWNNDYCSSEQAL